MALPNPIYVSPSTTIVQVNPLQNPYTPVLLSTVSYPGQLVTVIDTTSSIAALYNPIVLSTMNNSFQDTSISTLINQPQGFITAQSLPNSNWTFLNSFPFRNQYLSAGVQSLTTTRLFTATISTVQEYTSSLFVENLTVTGNFTQTQGITLTSSVSSLGTVSFISSLTVWDTVYLSSAMSTVGPMQIYSSLLVSGNVETKSSITTTSSLYANYDVVAKGSLFTPFLQFRDGLVGTSLEVQNSTQTTLFAGNTLVDGNLSAQSGMNVGGYLQTNTLFTSGYARFLSSAALYQDANVGSLTSTAKNFSTNGSFGVGNHLTVGLNTTTEKSVFVYGSASIQNQLTIASTLITSTLQATSIETVGSYTNKDTVAYLSSGTIDGNVGAGSIRAMSTQIGGTVQIGSNLLIGTTLGLSDSMIVNDDISSLAHFSIGQTASVEGNLTILGNASINSYLSSMNSITVQNSTILNSNGYQHVSVIGSVYSLGNLNCDGTLLISSIALPSSLNANNFYVQNSMDVGTNALVANAFVQKIVASTTTIGYIENTQYPLDIEGSVFLDGVYLSSPILSTVGLNTTPTSYGTGNFYVKGGMGIGVEPGISSFVAQPISYFSSATYVFSTLSTNIASANYIEGTFIGNGVLLSNIQYPQLVSSYSLLISGSTTLDISGGYIRTSTIQASTVTNEGTLIDQSSIQIGSLNIWGNAAAIVNNLGMNVIQTNTASNLLVMNDVKFIGNGNPLLRRRVAINEDIVGSEGTASLSVYPSLGVDSLVNTNSNFTINTYRGKTVLASTLQGFNGNILTTYSGYGITYISSGNISLSNSKMFIGENDSYDPRYNVVQPYKSTLQFNSTLFVNRGISSVGINTQPNCTLDAETIVVANVTDSGTASLIKNNIIIPSLMSTMYYAFVNSNATYTNVLSSKDSISWTNAPYVSWAYNNTLTTNTVNFASYASFGIQINIPKSILYYYDQQNNVLPQLFLGTSPTGLVGNITPLGIYNGYTYGLSNYTPTASIPDTIRCAATNGTISLASGTTKVGGSAGTIYSILVATDFLTFTPDTNTNNLFPVWSGRSNGAYGMVYGGPHAPAWIVVGGGCNSSAYRSYDAASWTLLTTGVSELRAIQSYQLPTGGTTAFLATGGTLSGTSIVSGSVITSTDQGSNWSNVGTLFTGSGLCIATDGTKVVVGGEHSGGQTLWYSYLNQSNTYNWQLCSGSLFTTRANAVLWSGSNWLAGGTNGVRQSADGIVWTDTGSIPIEVLNLGYTSNASADIQLGDSNKNTLLYMQNSPFIQSQQNISKATISYYSNAVLNINNGCVIDSKQNTTIPGYVSGISSVAQHLFASTLYTPKAYISSIVSTNRLRVGAYTLGIQSV